ncbi:hypothetical protein ANO11243_043740 [Dothideomycetidae sp. 11243]|nr:hypothetical protein ANO11243_043740 [fungal sp. No.11243]
MVVLRTLARLQSALFGHKQSLSGTGASGANWPTSLSTLYGWPPPKLDPSRDTAWLDGLRGVAAFLVMTYHYHLEWWGFYLEAPYGAIEDQSWQIWRLPFLRIPMCSGHTQVSVFFVLSGFVLSWSPIGSIRRGQHEKMANTLASATFRRWIRLYLPCFLIGLISVAEIRLRIIELPIGRKETLIEQLWDYLLACERFSDPLYIDRQEREFLHDYNWTMWTIPHEFGGSLLVFLIVLGVARIPDYRRRTLAIGSIVLYALIRARWTYWLFSYGVLLADYIRERGSFITLTSRRAKLIWTSIFVLGLWLAGIPERSPFYTKPGYMFLDPLTPPNWREIEAGGRFWWCWAGILLVTSCCHLLPLRRVFEQPLMRYLGRVSYMLYVTHRIVYEVFGRHYRKWLSTMLMSKKYSEELQAEYYTASAPIAIMVFIVSWVVLCPVAIFVAHWCEVFVDGPSVKFAKWVDQGFVKGWSQGGAGTQAAEMVHLTATHDARREEEGRLA